MPPGINNNMLALESDYVRLEIFGATAVSSLMMEQRCPYDFEQQQHQASGAMHTVVEQPLQVLCRGLSCRPLSPDQVSEG